MGRLKEAVVPCLGGAGQAHRVIARPLIAPIGTLELLLPSPTGMWIRRSRRRDEHAEERHGSCEAERQHDYSRARPPTRRDAGRRYIYFSTFPLLMRPVHANATHPLAHLFTLTLLSRTIMFQRIVVALDASRPDADAKGTKKSGSAASIG